MSTNRSTRSSRRSKTVYLLGVAPKQVRGAKLHAFAPLAQMVCDAPLPSIDGPPIMPLGIDHRDDVLALTAVVYPHYFRPRTMEMGRYFGIYEGGQLAAMIGERPWFHHHARDQRGLHEPGLQRARLTRGG
jgi:hypothetical protein